MGVRTVETAWALIAHLRATTDAWEPAGPRYQVALPDPDRVEVQVDVLHPDELVTVREMIREFISSYPKVE